MDTERVSDLPKVTKPEWGPAPIFRILRCFLTTDLMFPAQMPSLALESNLNSSCCYSVWPSGDRTCAQDM